MLTRSLPSVARAAVTRVRRPDNVLIGDEDIVEEHLVEFRVAGDLPQRPHLDTGANMSMIAVVMPACFGASDRYAR